MGRRVLCIDCDGVVFNTVGILKELIAKINYCCSDDFKKNVIDRADDQELASMYTRIQIITRDEVLEELNDMYKNRISYSELYTLKNTYPGVIDIIKLICSTGYFDKIYITTHVNTIQEALAKKEFFSKYLPMVEVFTIQFKTDPYKRDKRDYYANANRQRTNKPFEFFKATDEDPEGAIFVDDTESICKQAIDLGAEAFYCDNDIENPVNVFLEIMELINIENQINKRTI